MRGHTLKLGLAQGRRVAGNDDELGLAGAQSLEGRLVAERDLPGLNAALDETSSRSSSLSHCAP